jgi:hypothetical protein
MLYVVEIRRERGELAKMMCGIREWLDRQHFEPDAFRCVTAEESVTIRLEFGNQGEATACAETFAGRVMPPGDRPHS